VEADEFLAVRDLLRSFVAHFRTDSADLDPAARAAARQALGKLGLAELRRTSPPAATAQECALLAEEHGRQPMTTSFVGTALLAPELLRLLGNDEQWDSGTTPTIALARDLRFSASGPFSPSDLSDLVAWDCDGADGALCVAADGTVTAVALGADSPGADLGRAIRTIAPSPTPKLLGRLDPSQLSHWYAFALVMVSSELLGAARSLVQQSVDYARERRQYGQPIGSFQAVQHLLADATVLIEVCTSATRYAAWSLDNQQPTQALKAARVAKAEANASLPEAIRNAMQVFGGIAQTWEFPAHLYLRKILVGTMTLATNAELLTVLAGAEGAS
jgi:alkylation response protein AidB-like acyl-CoA dehydrogenase